MQARSKFPELEVLLAERGNALMATAVLLTGRRDAAEDLLQLALERVMRRASHVKGDPEGYLRRTMYNLATDRWRLLGRRREVLGAEADNPVNDHADGVEVRAAVRDILDTLPPKYRAALVLRYFEQLSEAESARVLGCSVGTIKANTHRALKRLREAVSEDEIRQLRC